MKRGERGIETGEWRKKKKEEEGEVGKREEKDEEK